MEKSPGSPPDKPPKRKKSGGGSDGTYGDILKKRNEGPFDEWNPKNVVGKERPAPKERKKSALKKGATNVEKKTEPTMQELAATAADKAVEMLDRDGAEAPNTRAVIEKLRNEVITNKNNPAKAKESLSQLADVAKKIQSTHSSKNGRSAAEVKVQVEPFVKKHKDDTEREKNSEGYEKFTKTEAELRTFLRQERIDAAAHGDIKKFNELGGALHALVDKEEAKKDKNIEDGESNPDVAEINASLGKDPASRNKEFLEIEAAIKAAEERKKKDGARAFEIYGDGSKEKTIRDAEEGLEAYGDGNKEKTARDSQLKAAEEEREKDEALALLVYGEGEKPKAERLRREAEQKQKEEALARELYGPGENEQTKIWTAQIESMTALVRKHREAHEARRRSIEEMIARKTPEHANWFRRSLAAYRAYPRWKKVALGAGLLSAGAIATIALGPASYSAWGIWLAQRGAAGVGAAAFADAALERKKSNWIRYTGTIGAGLGAAAGVAYLPMLFEHAPNTVSGALKSLGFNSGSGAETSWLKKPISSLSTLLPTELFSKVITVTEADRLRGLWGILDDKLTRAGILDSSLTAKAKNFKLYSLEKYLEGLGSDELKKIGFKSGNINIIHAGERLNLSILEKSGALQRIR